MVPKIDNHHCAFFFLNHKSLPLSQVTVWLHAILNEHVFVLLWHRVKNMIKVHQLKKTTNPSNKHKELDHVKLL